jgi:hypothetical protein
VRKFRTYFVVNGVTTEGSALDDETEAWEYLIEVHKRVIANAGGRGDDRTIARMRSAARRALIGSVEGANPADKSKTITYSVSSW